MVDLFDLTGIVAVVSTLVIAPAIVFSFLYKVSKNKHELKKLEYQKEILALELQKQDNHIKILDEENKKYDRIITGTESSAP